MAPGVCVCVRPRVRHTLSCVFPTKRGSDQLKHHTLPFDVMLPSPAGNKTPNILIPSSPAQKEKCDLSRFFRRVCWIAQARTG